MRARPATTTARALRPALCATMLALALSGCAGSANTTKRAALVAFKSAGITGHTLPALYTCDGKNIPPPLEWGTLPADTGELLLAAVGLLPTNAAASSYTASIEWAIAGVNPALHKLAAGQLPPGAHTGLSTNNQNHYSICPKKGTNERYQFMLYGLPTTAKISHNFADQSVLATITRTNIATAEGAFVTTYTRK